MTFGHGYELFCQKQPIPGLEGLSTADEYECVTTSSYTSFRYLPKMIFVAERSPRNLQDESVMRTVDRSRRTT